MCINIIQEKLEAIFEELLLLTIIEKYGTIGVAGVLPDVDMAPKVSILDLWRMWRRRRAQAVSPLGARAL